MDMLKGKVAIVTGATSGIGRRIVALGISCWCWSARAESSGSSTMTWCCGWRRSMKRARAVARFSRLALFTGRALREAEANPVIVRQNEVVAVDALAVLKEE